MFKFTNYVMMFAPIGVGAAMAHTIATNGLTVLKNLGLFIGSLYLALVVFVVVVFGAVMIIARVPIKQFLKAVREPFTIAFATTSSESALPKAMETWSGWACRNGLWDSSCRPATVSIWTARRFIWRWLPCLSRRRPSR